MFSFNGMQKTIRAGLWLDIFYFVINAPLGHTLALAQTTIITWLFFANETAFTEWLVRSELRWPIWVQFFVTLLLMDFVFYWQHRLFHRNRTCWIIHQIHHSSTELDWLSTARLHILEMFFFYTLIPQLLLLTGFAPTAFLYGNLFKNFYNFLLHANVPWSFGWLGNFIASPLFHRWHHDSSAGERNLATMFSLYDRLFGTWYLPTGRRPDSIGVPSTEVPSAFILQQLYPFRHFR